MLLIHLMNKMNTATLAIFNFDEFKIVFNLEIFLVWSKRISLFIYNCIACYCWLNRFLKSFLIILPHAECTWFKYAWIYKKYSVSNVFSFRIVFSLYNKPMFSTNLFSIYLIKSFWDRSSSSNTPRNCFIIFVLFYQ